MVESVWTFFVPYPNSTTQEDFAIIRRGGDALNLQWELTRELSPFGFNLGILNYGKDPVYSVGGLIMIQWPE